MVLVAGSNKNNKKKQKQNNINNNNVATSLSIWNTSQSSILNAARSSISLSLMSPNGLSEGKNMEMISFFSGSLTAPHKYKICYTKDAAKSTSSLYPCLCFSTS